MKRVEFTRCYGDNNGLKWPPGPNNERGYYDLDDEYADSLIEQGHAKIYVPPKEEAPPEQVNDDAVFKKEYKLPPAQSKKIKGKGKG